MSAFSWPTLRRALAPRSRLPSPSLASSATRKQAADACTPTDSRNGIDGTIYQMCLHVDRDNLLEFTSVPSEFVLNIIFYSLRAQKQA